MNYEIITNFIEKKYKAIKTIDSYKRQLIKFFNWQGIEPEKYIKRKAKSEIFQKEIEDYYEMLYKNDVPPKTRKMALSAIKVFLIYNLPDYDNKLPPSFWFKLSHGKYKGSGAVTNDKVPTIETLRKILMGANLKSKAIFMTLATSGMRVGECLELTWDDIDLSSNPPIISIKAENTKTKNPRHVFVSPETRDVLIQWKTSQEDYIKNRKRTSKKNKNPEKIFPFTYQNTCVMWWTMLRNANDKKGKSFAEDKDHGRHTYHIHTLRKFFRSRLAKTLSPDYIEFLMGHSTARTREYLYLPVEELAEEYIKGVDRLLIFQTPADTSDIREKLTEKDLQIKTMQETIEEMKAQIMEIRLARLEEKNGLKEVK